MAARHSGQSLKKTENKMRIRSCPRSMDEKKVEHILVFLKGAIQEIQRRNNTGLSFEKLYRNAYTLVLHKHGDQLYSTLSDVITDHLVNNVRPQVLEALSYNFLHTLHTAWTEHHTSMVMVADILMYMDRGYVNHAGVEPVYNLGLVIFRDQIVRFPVIGSMLRVTLLDIVSRERRGELGERIALKNACQMLMALGVNSRSVYEQEFEIPFLQKTSEFYRADSQRFLEENNASAFIHQVMRRMQDEKRRLDFYLDPSTQQPLEKVLDQELIQRHMKTVVEMENSGVRHMIANNKIEDLRCMYNVFTRVEEGLSVMTKSVSGYLREQGKALVTDPDTGSKALVCIQALLDLKDRFDILLRESFNDNRIFKQTINGDFEYFINLNPRSPEYLSSYLDDLLKKDVKGMSESGIEAVQDKCMVLFRFLQEKDVFERYYKQHLTKRLLHRKSNSDDSEKGVISKLKNECGAQFTMKLEGMFKDMSVSDSTMENFRTYVKHNDIDLANIDIIMRVLTTGYWPTQATKPCVLPRPADISFSAFKTFYLSKYSGRQLTLQSHLGTAELSATFYEPRRVAENPEEPSSSSSDCSSAKTIVKKHVLQVSTYQMCILMLFNQKERWTYDEIKQVTNMSDNDLRRAISPMAMGKSTQRVLRREVTSNVSRGIEFEEGDIFCVNDAFQSKFHRVRILTAASKGDTEPERRETRVKVDEDRKHEMEAAIVRIMKARKILQHSVLVAECVEHLKSRFSPSPLVIKCRIESLIERDYIQRCDNDRKVYKYVA